MGHRDLLVTEIEIGQIGDISPLHSTHPPNFAEKSTGTMPAQQQGPENVLLHPLCKKNDHNLVNGFCWENDKRPARLSIRQHDPGMLRP
jgi:hypothetical protein